MCLLRNIREKDDGWNAFFSGLVSGSSFFIEMKSRRSEMLKYAFPKAMEIIFNMSEKRGYIKTIKGGEVFLFSFAMGVYMYFMHNNPSKIKKMDKSILKLMFN
eukprot:TRINITY_DN2904_c0_g1_i1.p2 TRINITY_DN2904_c0_g1~~TRINITY_DN2904_c0_g1_i1.p2  ORF type:complete len:103 (-),score=14.04 TRINITY_DN2904_c0_g1_i1:103-411(-)